MIYEHKSSESYVSSGELDQNQKQTKNEFEKNRITGRILFKVPYKLFE